MAKKQKKAIKKANWRRLLGVFFTYFVITVAAAFLLSGLFNGFGSNSAVSQVSLGELVSQVAGGQVEKVVIKDSELDVFYKDGSQALARMESGANFYQTLQSAGIDKPAELVNVEVSSPTIGDILGAIISNLLPIVIMIVFFLFLFRQVGRGGAGGVFDFGKSTARLFTKDQPQVSFADAAGVDEAKKELEEVVDFLRYTEKYRKLGARIPKGVLLVGPAGSGKTLLARAVANEAQVPFYSMAGSEFMEMLVGVGASRVRDLFKQAKENAPALIFIDEIESIGRQRGRSVMNSNSEQEQTLNQILVEMDGFSPNDNVIVLAATNRPDLLDDALTRPGRFDRRVVLQLPDIKGREDIVRIHLRNKPIAEGVDIHRLAKVTAGFSGADLENMLNEAAILAASNGQTEITQKDVTESITKVRLGRERRQIQTDQDRRITAYHEAGHAIVAKMIPGMDPVSRVSIISRGLALGFTEINPEQDRYHLTMSDLESKITALLGGRAAEELVFNDRTAGASNDLEKANTLAYKMVTEFGMSDLGPVAYPPRGNRGIFEEQEGNRYSEEMGSKVDNEVRKIIERNYHKAQEILKDKRSLLDQLASMLIQNETIEQEELEALIAQNVHE